LPTIPSYLHQTFTNLHQLLIQFYKPKTIITYPFLVPCKFRTFPRIQHILYTTHKPNQYLFLEPFSISTLTYSLYLKITRSPPTPQNETSLKKLDTDLRPYNPSLPNKPPYTTPITYLFKQSSTKTFTQLTPIASKTTFTLFPIQECYSIIPNYLFLLLGGDIETNPGPTCIWLRNHPIDHKQRSRIYFIPNTITLRPEYQQLSSSFEPHINLTHPDHPSVQHTHPFLTSL
jgi:hypothetical protein